MLRKNEDIIDKMNAVFAGIGFNMRKLLKAMSNFLSLYQKRLVLHIVDRALACFTPPASLVAGRSMLIQLPLTALQLTQNRLFQHRLIRSVILQKCSKNRPRLPLLFSGGVKAQNMTR